MIGLGRILDRWRGRRVALVGIGDPALGDDGAGVRLADAVSARLGATAPQVQVIQAGTAPEHVLTRLCGGAFDHVVFLDAVDFGGAPGETALAGGAALAARHPQVSTHRLSLGLLARIIEDSGQTRAWLLGIQPEAIRPAEGLSPPVRTTVDALADLLASGLGAGGGAP